MQAVVTLLSLHTSIWQMNSAQQTRHSCEMPVGGVALIG